MRKSLFCLTFNSGQLVKTFVGHQIILIFIISHLSPPIAFGQKSEGGFSLQQALTMAFASDNNLMAARAYLRSSEYEVKRAKTAYLPSLALAGSYSHLSRVNEFSIPIGAMGQQYIKTSSDNPFSANLALNFNLYTFGRRSGSVAVARAENRMSNLHYTSVKKNLFNAVASTYFAVVFDRESLHMLEKEKERFEQVYEIVVSRFDQDLISEFDLLQSQFRLQTYEKTAFEMANNLKMAQLELARLLGVSSDLLPIPSDSLSADLLLVPSPEDWDEVFPRREDYLEAITSVQQAQSVKKMAKSMYFPTLAVFTSYDWRNGYQPDIDEILGNFTFGVNLSWLLFDGFARQTDISKQNYLITASNRAADDIKLSIPFQIKSLQLSLENDSLRINIQKQALLVAQRSMAIAQKRYDIGDLTMIELLEAENKLSQTELELLKLKYEYIITQLDLKMATGFYPEIEKFD